MIILNFAFTVLVYFTPHSRTLTDICCTALRFYELSFTDCKIDRVLYRNILLEDSLDVILCPKNLQKNLE